MKKAKVFILYDYFDPAFKAGGPIRSLVNLVQALQEDMDLYILTSNMDLDMSDLEVQSDSWLSYGSSVKVIYLSRHRRNGTFLKSLIQEEEPDVIYINGIYSWFFVIMALKVLRQFPNIKTIIAPRGMLQKRPLSIKPLKKRIYLFYLKLILPKKLTWHVTTEQEQEELPKFTRAKNNVSLIGNLPSFKEDWTRGEFKDQKVVTFGTVALISPMKNIHLVLETLADINADVIYKIYGPIKDQDYWNMCLRIVDNLPSHVTVEYHGAIKRAADMCAVKKTIQAQPEFSVSVSQSVEQTVNIRVAA